MRHTFVRAVVLAALISMTLWLVGRDEGQALGQGGAAPAPQAGGRGGAPAAPAGGQVPAGRGGRGGGAQGGGRGAVGAAGAAQTAQAAASNDLTGYWVRLVTEDWRWLMLVPPKGNVDSIGVSAAGRAILDAWDPAKDETEGNQCKGYGAGAISRLPTRAHVTWQDGNTLKWETDQGMQTRLFKFGATAREAEANPGARSWQGLSVATWEPAAGGRGGGFGGGAGGAGGRGGAPVAATDGDADPDPPPAAPPAVAGARGGNQNGWLKVVTTNVKSGYLRKNGLPYSEKATITEYFQPTPETYGARYMIVTTIIEDPEYLSGTLVTSSNYKKLPDTNNGWDPQPCSVR
jgi:hypothetical protein